MKKLIKVLKKEIEKAFLKKEIPVAAMIIENGKIVAKAHNLKETTNNPCAHAEILAIEKLAKKRKSWRLQHTSILVNLFPCIMCYGAIVNSRIECLFYIEDGIHQQQLQEIKNINHNIVIIKVHYPELSTIVSSFFKERRKEIE